MSVTTTSPAGTSATASGGGQKDFSNFVKAILPDVTGTVAPSLGIDPRVVGQTISQVLSIFGIGGPGKAFTPTVLRDQALSQVQQVVTPHLNDLAFTKALEEWVKAAIEPVQAHKAGKPYQPDMSKNWLGDVADAVSDAASSAFDVISDNLGGVDWGEVTRVGLQVAPTLLAAL